LPYATFPVKRLAIHRPIRNSAGGFGAAYNPTHSKASGLGDIFAIVTGVLQLGANVYEMKQTEKMQANLIKAQAKAKALEVSQANAERQRQEDERKRLEAEAKAAAEEAAAIAKVAAEQKAVETKQKIEEAKNAPLFTLPTIPEGVKTYLYVGGGLALLGIAYLIYSKKKKAAREKAAITK
jgi:hypothetical protein